MDQAKIVIADVEIPTDAEGRLNLSVLQRAVGLDERLSPRQWLKLENMEEAIKKVVEAKKSYSTDQIIDLHRSKEFSLELAVKHYFNQELINVVDGDTDSDVFAIKPLALAYAMWIDPYFYFLLTKAFSDFEFDKPDGGIRLRARMAARYDVFELLGTYTKEQSREIGNEWTKYVDGVDLKFIADWVLNAAKQRGDLPASVDSDLH